MVYLINSLSIELSSNNIVNGKLSGVLMLPNIFQLTGAILTLWFGLRATIFRRNNLKKQLLNEILTKEDEQEKQEIGELFNIVQELRVTSKEKNYISAGIFLICVGYVSAIVGLDIKLFNLYSYSLRAFLIISILLIVKSFNGKQKVSSNLWRIVSLISIGFLTYTCFVVPLSTNLKIVFAFSGSTAFLILISVLFIEKLFVREANWDFKQQLDQASIINFNKLKQLMDQFNAVTAHQQKFAQKTYNQNHELYIKNQLLKPIWDNLNMEYQEGSSSHSNIEVVDILEDTQYEDGKYFVKVSLKINNHLVEMVFCNIYNSNWDLLEKRVI
jgi:hypothetical protein